MNIYEKLQAIRVELSEMKLKKSGNNTFSKFKYYELADFLPQTMILFKKHNLFSKFDIKERVVEGIELTREVAILTITDIDDIESALEFESPTAEVNIGVKADGKGGAQPIQNLGGKHTYLKRYLYVNALEFSENDAVDRSVKEPQHEIYNFTYIPMSKVQKTYGETFRELLQKLGGRIVDLKEVYSKFSMGGTLESATVKQLGNIEKHLAGANYKESSWFSVYGQNSRIKDYIGTDIPIEYQSTRCKFAVMAYNMADNETKKLDVLETYQGLDIDITAYLEV